MSRRWKILIAIPVVLLVLAGLWLAAMRFQPESEVEAYKKSLRARGEKLEIAEMLPPAVPPEKNGADIVRAAFSLLAPSSQEYTNRPSMMFMIAPGKAMVCWSRPDVRDSNSTNSWENIGAAVADNRPATESLKRVLDFPAIDFQLDYSKGPELLLPQLSLLKCCAQRLAAAAVFDLHTGNAASATTNLGTLLALVQETRDERLVISQLVRMAMAQIACAATWELLQSTNADDAQLARLQKSWERLEFIEPTEASLLMERASTELTIQKMRATDTNFNRFMGVTGSGGSGGAGSFDEWLDHIKGVWDDTKFAGARFMWRTSWSYSDELHLLQSEQIVLEAIRAVNTNQVFNPAYTNMLNKLMAVGITNNPDNWLLTKLDIRDFREIFSGTSSGLSSAIRRTMAAEATKRIVVAAIALKRFQLRRGNLPITLSELTPEFLVSVPPDPVDGKPLRYRCYADGTYQLYSIGSDGIDDGGDPDWSSGTGNHSFYWQNDRALDWVWPQPATPEEVQNFYEHPPK